MGNTTPTTIRQWNEEIFQQLYQYYQGVSNMSNTGTFNIKNVLEYMRKILFNKKFNIPNEDAMKSSVLEGMITFKQDSYNAFKAFKDSIEVYIEIAMFNIQLLDKKEIVGNSLSIGKCNKRLLEFLQERCRLSENEIRKLSYFIEEGETWRNIWHHNTPPKEDADVHKKGCQIALEYLFAVSAACRRIEMARGGIRFIADTTCTLDFYNGEQNRTFTYVDVNHPLQIEGKAGVYTLKITTNDKDGAKTFTREGLIKSNQYNDEILQKDSRAHKKNKIRIAPVLNLGSDALEGIPWKQGNYLGAVDSEGQPHGIGTYIQEDKSFGGRFQHGEPQGTFIVSCPEFKYKGTIIAKNDAPWDLDEGEMEMSDSRELKFIGRFKNFCCVDGKLLIENKISYEGTFKTINGQTTVSGIGTLYLPDNLIYRGEVFNGVPHGRGCIVDEQALEATYTDWYMGESIADELRELHIKGNEPVKLYDNKIFLCDITLKGIYLNYSVERPNLIVENNGGDTLSYSIDESQKKEWIYNIEYTLKVYKTGNGKYGLTNKKGNIIISPYYDDIDISDYKESGLIRVKTGEKYGYINKDNENVIPIVYDGIKYISKEDGFRVKLHDKYGYINENGKIIIPIEYLNLDYGWHDGWLLAQNSQGRIGYINKGNDSFLFFNNKYVTYARFSEGLARVKYKEQRFNREDLLLWGFVDVKGNLAIPCLFDDADSFENGFANVVYRGVPVKISKNYGEPEIVKGDNGKFGLKNKLGKFVTPFIYDKIVPDGNFYQHFHVILNGLQGIIDYEGNILLEPLYNKDNIDFTSYSFNSIYIFNKEGKSTAIFDRHLKDTNIYFDQIVKSVDGAFWGQSNGIWNLFKYDSIEKSFKKFLFDYQSVINPWGRSIVLVKRNNKYGYVNIRELKESIPCIYEDANDFVYDYFTNYTVKFYFATVKLNGKWGIINERGNIKLNFEYDSLKNVRDCQFIAIKNDKCGVILIEDSHDIIAPFIYDDIETDFWYNSKTQKKEKCFCVKENGKWGAIYKNGGILLPCLFNYLFDLRKVLNRQVNNTN